MVNTRLKIALTNGAALLALVASMAAPHKWG